MYLLTVSLSFNTCEKETSIDSRKIYEKNSFKFTNKLLENLIEIEVNPGLSFGILFVLE